MARHARMKPVAQPARTTHRAPASTANGPASFTATVAKKEFGRLLDIVLRGGRVVITRHDAPRAVVLSMEDFNALAQATERTLDTLSGEFDALLARMQMPKARAGLKAAFDASPKAIGTAAVAAARKRG